jgi:8-oxo-dGTP diphosphatase
MQDQLLFGSLHRTCEACQFVQFNDPKVATCAFVVQDQQVLLVKRGIAPEMGKWALPAGYVDYGEDPAQAAIRETQEETGLLVEITGLEEVMLTQALHAVILIIYRAHPIGGQLQAGDDAQDAAWFSFDALPEIAFESTQRMLARWLTTLPN